MRAITSRVRIMLQRRESRPNFRTGPPGTVGEEQEVTETTGRPFNSKQNENAYRVNYFQREWKGVKSSLVPKNLEETGTVH